MSKKESKKPETAASVGSLALMSPAITRYIA